MAKKQVAILAGLGMAVLIVFCVLGYLVVDKVAITSGGVSISLAITPKPTSTLRPTPRPQPTWPPTWTPTPKPIRTPRPTPTPQPTWTPTPAPVWSDYNSRAYAVLLDLDALRKEMLGAFGTGDVNLVCAYSRDWQRHAQDCQYAWDRLTPPPTFQAYHELMSACMGKLALYSQNVALGCETGNRAYIDQADIYYNQAMDDWERANEMLKDLQ